MPKLLNNYKQAEDENNDFNYDSNLSADVLQEDSYENSEEYDNETYNVDNSQRINIQEGNFQAEDFQDEDFQDEDFQEDDSQQEYFEENYEEDSQEEFPQENLQEDDLPPIKTKQNILIMFIGLLLGKQTEYTDLDYKLRSSMTYKIVFFTITILIFAVIALLMYFFVLN